MEHFIEADGDGSVAVREPRRDLQTAGELQGVGSTNPTISI